MSRECVIWVHFLSFPRMPYGVTGTEIETSRVWFLCSLLQLLLKYHPLFIFINLF